MRIINVYHPPGPLSASTLQIIHDLIDGPTLVVGDFNAHHPTWDNHRADGNGTLLHDWAQENSMTLLNDGSPTYFSRNCASSPDLTLASPGLLPSVSWHPHPHLLGSDHFPLLTTLLGCPPRPAGGHYPSPPPHWPRFAAVFPVHFHPPPLSSVQALSDSLTKAISTSSSLARPPRPRTPRHPPLPWWTPACSRAIRDRNQALYRARRSFQDVDWIWYKRMQAVARRTLRRCKMDYWHRICDSLNCHSNIRALYRIINSIRGRRRDPAVHPLLREGTHLTDPQDIASTLAAHFAASAFPPFSPPLTLHPSPPSLHTLYLNADIHPHELRRALASARDSAPGGDGIRISHLSHLPPDGMAHLLSLLNLSWTTGSLPATWKHSTIIPVLKPNKPPHLPSSYRPIALTSHVGKLLERIINTRLTHYLETNRLLPPALTGFRPFRSINNHLVALAHDAARTIHRRHYLAVVLLDIHQAYDSTPHAAVLAKLYKLCDQGRLLTWVGELLHHRYFQVRVSGSLSAPLPLRRGLPQGSILSPTLFNILMHDLPLPPTHNIHLAVYADDIALWSASPNLDAALNRMQVYLNELHSWAGRWGLHFSPTKSEYTVITRHHLERVPPLHIDDLPIPFRPEIRYLGTILDTRYRWEAHLQATHSKITAATNALRCITGLHWGTRRTTLLHLFRSLVRPHLDRNAFLLPHSPRVLSHFQTLQNRALRICLGARRSTAIPSLHLEANELPVRLRWTALITSWSYRQAFLGVDSDWLQRWAQRDALSFYRTSASSSPLCVASSFIATQAIPPPVPFPPLPWPVTFTPISDFATFLLPESSGLQKSLSEEAARATFYQTLADFPDHTLLATDGAVLASRAGAGIYSPQLDLRCAFRLPDGTSIASAELWALLYAYNSCPAGSPRVFITDSLSSLRALLTDRHSPPNHLALTLQQAIRTAPTPRHNVFLWVPGHLGIPPNVQADHLAAEGRSLPLPSFESLPPLTFQDCKRMVWDAVIRTWRQENTTHNSKYPHLLTTSPWPSLLFSSRATETKITRLRLGHSLLKASLARIRAATDDLCSTCRVPETTDHYLLSCRRLEALRQRTIAAACERRGVAFSSATLLSLGQDAHGNFDRDVIQALDEFITLSRTAV